MSQGRRNFLFTIAGVRQEILDKCPSERVKFQSLGVAILITSLMATVSMWFALNSVLGLNAAVALIGAVGWGLIILGIDRWLVTSMPATGGRRWTIALPRLVLALLLGSLISTPIVLRIFQSEINAQIVLIKQERASSFIALQQKSKVGQQVNFWTRDVANLQKVIDSNGNVPLNPSTDPVVISLTRQRKTELGLEHQYYEQWQCQLYGGKGCTRKGNGPLAQASHKSYRLAAAQVTKLTGQIQARDKQLNANDTASQKRRLDQAKSALPGAKQHLTVAVGQEDALEQKYETENISTNGLLIRLEALNQLSGKSFTINAARLLLFLLFLVIECLPVTVKLLQEPGNYEKILKQASEQELREARSSYGSRPRTSSGSARPAAAGPNGTASLADVEAELRDMWRSSAGLAPGREAGTVLEAEPAQATGSEDSTRLIDEKLRQMDDLPVTGDTDRRAGFTEFPYRDDEL